MSLVLDPAEVAVAGRTELDLMSYTIMVRSEGIDWGDTAMELSKGVSRYGEPVLDYRLPNRVITAPIRIQGEPSGATMDEAMQDLQAKVAVMATEGGTIKRVRATNNLYADVVSASVVIPDTWTGEHQDYEAEGEITLECLPDFYGDEIVEVLPAGANNVLTDVFKVKGNYPARANLEVTAGAQAQRGLMYAARGRYYDSAASAALSYEAEALEPLGGSVLAALAGSVGAGNNVVRNTNVSKDWTSVMGTRIGGATYLTHRGVYRVLARVYTTTATPPILRLLWSQGDLVSYSDNAPKVVPGQGGFYIVDLGEVRLGDPPMGGRRWQGIIQAQSTSPGSGTANINIDRLVLQPVAESSGKVATDPSQVINPSAFVVNDQFNQTAGNLTGKAPTPSGTGLPNYSALIAGATDFTVDGSGLMQRISGMSPPAVDQAKRAVGLTLGMSDVDAAIDFSYSGTLPAGIVTSELIVRAVNSTNYLVFRATTSLDYWVYTQLQVIKVVGGVSTVLAQTGLLDYMLSGRLRITVIGANFTAYLNGTEILSGSDSVLATGGTLATGGVFIGDAYLVGGGSGSEQDRTYDNFQVATTVVNSAIFANRKLACRTDGCYRQSSDGNGYGEIVPYGDLLRLPVSGRENRDIQLLVMNSRGNFDDVPDSGLDSMSAILTYRPCWSSVPEAT